MEKDVGDRVLDAASHSFEARSRCSAGEEAGGLGAMDRAEPPDPGADIAAGVIGGEIGDLDHARGGRIGSAIGEQGGGFGKRRPVAPGWLTGKALRSGGRNFRRRRWRGRAVEQDGLSRHGRLRRRIRSDDTSDNSDGQAKSRKFP